MATPADRVKLAQIAEEPLGRKEQQRLSKALSEAEHKAKRWERRYTNTDSTPTEEGVALHYCRYCGSFCFMFAQAAHTLSRRATDKAYIINTVELTFKSDLQPATTPVVIRRPDKTLERQYRYNCASCGVHVGYKSSSSASLLYVLDDAVINDPRNMLTVDAVTGKQQQQPPI
jgi:hypothetical protein